MPSSDEINKLVSTIQMLKNRDLMSICSACHVTKSGIKAELQRRIISCEYCIHVVFFWQLLTCCVQ